MLYVVIIIVIMNLERRFHLFQDFLIEMSNGVVYNVRSINLKKLDKPTLRYEGRRITSNEYSDFEMIVNATDYVLTIDVICKCRPVAAWVAKRIHLGES